MIQRDGTFEFAKLHALHALVPYGPSPLTRYCVFTPYAPYVP